MPSLNLKLNALHFLTLFTVKKVLLWYFLVQFRVARTKTKNAIRTYLTIRQGDKKIEKAKDVFWQSCHEASVNGHKNNFLKWGGVGSSDL